MQDRMVRGLHDHLLPRVQADPAVVATHRAFPLEAGAPSEYVLETHWRTVGDLIRFAGDDWRTPRVEPCEEELLVSVSAHHFLTNGVEPAAVDHAGPHPTEVWLDDV